MLVPGHVVSLYVATSGLPGAGLGSDEKEVILLVYVIIDVQTSKIVGIKQYLVRPVDQVFGKDSNTLQNAILPNSTEEPQIPSDMPISETLLQKAGKPLNEVIDQFDAYTRSLSLDPNSSNFRIVTDGQLPLRQCLHPEASAKEINLPAYYWRFSDLRKEYVRFKTGDLSRALIPMSDVTKLQNMPSLPPPPQSISEMMTDLELTPYQENDFYIKESFDMVQIIQTLLAAGHKFDGIETVDLTLEPGICSIDDEIDGTCIVRARGLPWQSSDQDIAKFFRGLNVAKGGVALCLSPQGRRNGEALIRFISQEHRDMALKRHKHHIGQRYIEVYRASGEDFLAVAGGASNEAQTFLSKGAQVIIRMRGLPYDCTSKQVLDFFSTGDNPCTVLDGADGVLFVKKPDGRATGDAFVLFPKEADASKALSRHRESIGQRYIELFRSTTAEVQQVLNRSMDPKTYEPLPPPLIAQLPSVQMPLLPQHVITSGTEKSCIRLRGLPYEAKVEHILHFLEEFSKHIIYQGVHLVYNAQGQFNGEAFIQMDSETAAFSSAQQKHHKYMMFGKKQRYIEVFQCSGDDMNMVLNGGFQAPSSISKPPLLSPGGTIVAQPFGGFSPYGPPTAVLPPRGHPAFYPQPILYWRYPSPPVSPTTYYGPAPTHMPPNLPPNLSHQHQPTLLTSATDCAQAAQVVPHHSPSTAPALLHPIVATTPVQTTSTINSPPNTPTTSQQQHSPQPSYPSYPPTSPTTHQSHSYSNNHHHMLSPGGIDSLDKINCGGTLHPAAYHIPHHHHHPHSRGILTPINMNPAPAIAPNQYVEVFIV